MIRPWLIASIGALSFIAAGCGGYDDNQAYDAGNAEYDAEGNAAYGEGDANAAYDAAGNNAAYTPPDETNLVNDSIVDPPPPTDPTGNGY